MAAVVIGKRGVVEAVLCAVLAGGHVLLEDVPGVGKTLLAKTLARSLDLSFARVQFTPDLLPADLVGSHLWDPREAVFRFRAGPLFHHLVLADEINRASPRTQSALLEAMEEAQVTVEGTTYPLPRPFLVIATANARTDAGTFPLPEAQLDRFLFRLHLGYPSPEEEVALLRQAAQAEKGPPRPLLGVEAVLRLQQEVRAVRVADAILRYVAQIAHRTRTHPALALGASPRAAVALVRGAQAWALLHGRRFVVPDDVRTLLPWVLGHRLVPRPETAPFPLDLGEGWDEAAGGSRSWTSQVLRQIVEAVDLPGGEGR
ncbi:MAG: MoxR family ATPase [Alicyclobacillaceae bacterium]|nr:MoxR family ATPase [Alicyclobacillaceae bacterium]